MGQEDNRSTRNRKIPMTDQELIDGLALESEPFKNFFRVHLALKVNHANAVCGYGYPEFVAALNRMFDDPGSLRQLSVEHRMAVKSAYLQTKAIWEEVAREQAAVVKP